MPRQHCVVSDSRLCIENIILICQNIQKKLAVFCFFFVIFKAGLIKQSLELKYSAALSAIGLPA